MTIRQIELETLYFLILGAFIGMTIAISNNHTPRPNTSFSVPVVQTFKNQVDTLMPTPKETSVQLSPDGTKKVTMTQITNKDQSKSYTVTTADESGGNEKSIYSVILPQNESLSIPFNTWSPDDTFVFLEHHSANTTEALAFRADGTPMAQSEQYYNITNIFNLRSTGYTYQETTGWASDTLLIVNTTQSDGSKGASFWVEVPSKAVIQLSTQF